jgi:WD40 repeat protein
MFKYHYPLTYFTFIKNTSLVLLGTADGKILLIDTMSSETFSEKFKLVAEHENPILKIFFISNSDLVVTVDMKDTIILWNYKGMNLLQKVKVKNLILDCDFVFPLLMVALNDNQLFCFNVLFPSK